jgi:hypothetical protein
MELAHESLCRREFLVGLHLAEPETQRLAGPLSDFGALFGET